MNGVIISYQRIIQGAPPCTIWTVCFVSRYSYTPVMISDVEIHKLTLLGHSFFSAALGFFPFVTMLMKRVYLTLTTQVLVQVPGAPTCMTLPADPFPVRLSIGS